MADPLASGSSKSLHIYQEDHVVRTGILKYYDPLMFSDLAYKTLAELNVIDHTLPATDPTSNESPDGINFAKFDLTIISGS
jgi:hypothetical protein